MTRHTARRRSRARPKILRVTVLVLGGLLVLAALGMLLKGPGSARAAIEVAGQPRLRVDREVVDLGAVRLGRTVEASFVLTNVGDQPLRFAEAPWIEVIEGC